MAGQKEEITLITEEISSPDQVMHDKAVIYIDDALAYEGIEFIGDSSKVDKNYYEFGGEGITYMFRERIPVENARRIKTMVILAEADLAKTPTGFSVSSIPREGNLLYAIVLVVLLITIMGGYLMVRKDPSQKKLVSALAKDVEDALDLLDDGKEQKAFGLFPSILKKHSVLEKENQDQFTEMLVYLHGKLERHNFGMMLRNLEKEASFVGESMDDLVFDRFIGAFNMAAKKYNDLDDQVKTEFFGEIDRWYRLVKEMQEIR